MMIDPNLICMQCMKELHERNGICRHCGFDNAVCANSAHQLACGSILAGTYLVGRILGQGGFGITYIGYDLNLDIRVAIKEYYPEGSVTRDMRTQSTVLVLSEDRRAMFEAGKEHFVQEARVLARFSGEKGIVGVRSFFFENGTAYIVMDYVEGETLKSYVAKHGGNLPAEEVLRRFEALFKPLSRVHEAGLLHRDISPDNIMLTKDDSLVLLDFGAARQISVYGEHSNTINVKHGFAPEEQYRKRGEQGPWTDVYALSATIYRLITGVTPPEALDRLMNDDTIKPPNALGAGLTHDQERALMHGLAVRAALRTPDLQTLYKELYIPKTGPNPPPPPPKPPFGWKKYAPMIGAGVVLVAAVVLLILKPFSGTRGSKTAREESTPTQTMQPLENVLATPKPTAVPTDTPTLAPVETPFYISDSNAFDGIVAASVSNTLLLKNDGTVICLGAGGMDTSGWKNIIQLAARDNFAVGLKSDGTLVATGDVSHGEGDVYNWRNVAQVDCGYQHTVAVTADGSVYYAGVNLHGRASCENWSNVVRVLAGSDHLAAILGDGSVVAAGYAADGRLDTGSFSDVITGDVGGGSTFCVRRDGTVLVTGANKKGEDNVQDWTNIVAISASGEHTVGLRSDGTVVATGSNEYGQCDTEGWRNIVAIAAGGNFTVGVQADGSIVAVGSNDQGQISVGGIRLW
ncbi:MAG TPA: protein kinase [Clostridia bacterium]|nr:protein kinase [Clostridia bacterium]